MSEEQEKTDGAEIEKENVLVLGLLPNDARVEQLNFMPGQYCPFTSRKIETIRQAVGVYDIITTDAFGYDIHLVTKHGHILVYDRQTPKASVGDELAATAEAPERITGSSFTNMTTACPHCHDPGTILTERYKQTDTPEYLVYCHATNTAFVKHMRFSMPCPECNSRRTEVNGVTWSSYTCHHCSSVFSARNSAKAHGLMKLQQ